MTQTIYFVAPTGGTYYAFPPSQSLADWTTYRVLLAEGTGANVGRYSGSVDEVVSNSWHVFSGSAQPAAWSDYVAAVQLSLDPAIVSQLTAFEAALAIDIGSLQDSVSAINASVSLLTGEITPELHPSQVWALARIDGEVQSRHVVTKNPTEELVVDANFAQLLGENETIASLDAIELASGDVESTAFGAVAEATQVGTHVLFTVTDGTEESNEILVKVTTSHDPPNVFAAKCRLKVTQP